MTMYKIRKKHPPTPVKEVLMLPLAAWRQAAASKRSVPDFLIIGAIKASTTPLNDHLCQHQERLSIENAMSRRAERLSGIEVLDNEQADDHNYRLVFSVSRAKGLYMEQRESPPKKGAPEALRAKLTAVFREPNRALAKETGIEFDGAT